MTKPMTLEEKIELIEAACKVADFWEVEPEELIAWVAIRKKEKIAEWDEIANDIFSFYKSQISKEKRKK